MWKSQRDLMLSRYCSDEKRTLSVVMLLKGIVPCSVVRWSKSVLFCYQLPSRGRRNWISRVQPDEGIAHPIMAISIFPPVTLPVEFG